MKIIKNRKFDQERALYGSRNLIVENCKFDGSADGESFLKECKNIEMKKMFLQPPLSFVA